ncbi:hypothetical protein PPYR_04113 [Photinus pyralis]|uniref:Uncharacterized protein n=2 Tax=Photinus pyralis TaxID=7054 RepID=A0A1Y1M2D0_PHOPY|nr:hypothetical protein PPYR_03957 [Photinus pyralis]KAB0801927.1 hypothetical protein PPYR_04113 [Photinus pyralis]
MSTSNESIEESSKWLHPNQLLKLQRLKVKRRQLQARINNSEVNVPNDGFNANLNNISVCGKRPNPFVKPLGDCKRTKLNVNESSDGTLFGLLHSNDAIERPHALISFNKTISVPNDLCLNKADIVPPIKAQHSWVPIDWTLNCKLRLLSSKPFSWSHKLKISEEASGITAFVRCLNYNSETTLDTSPNAKFHQCCLYWQQPHFPWLSVFPRTQAQSSSGPSFVTTAAMRDNLHMAWSDGLRSLFQLLRTRQCPFFYVCTNTFTVLFRAAGICGHAEMVALITPTTYGFRQLLRQEEIEFSMPLKVKSGTKDKGDGSDDEGSEEKWLASMGINAEDRKQISYTEKQRHRKTECEVDNSEGSLVLIQGMEVHGLYNFLINCKSATSITGSLAGIPPTLLSPIAFQGATLSTLKVKETKILIDNVSYFSLELNGPILPHIIHNLSELNPQDQSFTATFGHITSSMAFSKLGETEKIETDSNTSGFSVFSKENLSDCGLTSTILKHFCSSEKGLIQNVDSLKYNPEIKSYTWL